MRIITNEGNFVAWFIVLQRRVGGCLRGVLDFLRIPPQYQRQRRRRLIGLMDRLSLRFFVGMLINFR